MDAEWKRLRDRVRLTATWVWAVLCLAVVLLFFVVFIGGGLGMLGDRTGNMKPTTGTPVTMVVSWMTAR
ncbi:MAG: hypothetical protein OEO77_13590 [Acidimicrobiia bacterium]|nr:hypothetical protein [Acidimicrobiia bacterium]